MMKLACAGEKMDQQSGPLPRDTHDGLHCLGCPVLGLQVAGWGREKNRKRTGKMKSWMLNN